MPDYSDNLNNASSPKEIKSDTSTFSYLLEKFGSPKVMATVLGMLLLAGGVGAGVILVMQPQRPASIAYLGEPPPTLPVCGTNVCGATYLVNGAHCRDAATSAEKYCCPQNYLISGSTCVAPPNTGGSCTAAQAGTRGNCNAGYRCSISGGCQPDIGVGNCAVHTGNCFVHSSIGIEDDPGSNNYRDVCDYGGHWTTCEQGYVCSNYDCVPAGGPSGSPRPTTPPNNPPAPTPRLTPTPTPTRSPSPTPSSRPSPTPVAACSATKIYTPAWALITNAQFSSLPAGGQVYFCVNGTASSGTFDMARFTVNNTLRANVTLQRPGSTDFCDLYTIPANTYTFTVQGEIHHTTLGWR